MSSAVGREAYFRKTRADRDILSLDAVYHRAYLTKLCRKAETVGCGDIERSETQVIRAHVLSELIYHIKEYRGSGESLHMADITTLYDERGFST